MIVDVSQELKQKAISVGLCEEWTREWGNPDKEELMNKYVRGIDFAIEHNFPSTDYMVRHFDGVMQKHGVYVSEPVHLKNPPMLVACGDCKGKVVFDEYTVGRLYIRHQSDISVLASGNAKVFISTYDNCKLNVICKDQAKVYVYKEGGTVTKKGNVLVKADHK